jgi:hypothetical protein
VSKNTQAKPAGKTAPAKPVAVKPASTAAPNPKPATKKMNIKKVIVAKPKQQKIIPAKITKIEAPKSPKAEPKKKIQPAKALV